MSFEWHLDQDDEIVFVTVKGETNIDLAEARARSLANALADHRGAPIIMDIRESNFVPSVDEAQRLAELYAEQPGLGQHPIAVLGKPGVLYGVGRMVSTLSSLRGALTEAFDDPDEAVRWAKALPRPEKT